MKLSVVIPVFNEGLPLVLLCERIESEIKKSKSLSDFEIILVDDHSKDNSWDVIVGICKKNLKVKGVKFIRNFGQHSALTAGLSFAKGDFVLMMDCDGQDNPKYIEALLDRLIDTESSIVFARRKERKSPLSSVFFSWLINMIMTRLSGFYHDKSIGTFRLMLQKVVQDYLAMSEKKRYLGSMFYWLGHKSDFLDVVHEERASGKSQYTFKKSLKLAKLGILNSSTKLLSIGIYIGFFGSVFSIFFGIYFLVMKLVYQVPMGYTSIILSILFVGSSIMLLLGIIGEYLGEIFDEIKGRPNYVIDELINVSNE